MGTTTGTGGGRTGPDFQRMEEYDRLLPPSQPVTEALLARLPLPLRRGSTVLDIACGTGEPGLTLARRHPGVDLLGVDTAPPMVEAARRKAAGEPVPGARFEVAPAEALGLGSASVDAVVSRFGALLVGDPEASAAEMARVLGPGGPFSLAVWGRAAENVLVSATVSVLRETAAGGGLPSLGFLDDLAEEGRRAGLLTAAGIATVQEEPFTWSYAVGADDLWPVATVAFGPLVAQLSPQELERARNRHADSLAAHRAADGVYRIPHECRLLWGSR